MIGIEVLRAFRAEFSVQLTEALARADGVEDIFKGFGTRIRATIDGAARPLLRHLERTVGVRAALLVRESDVFAAHHPRDASLVVDLQGLMHAADDILATRRTKAGVLTLGRHIRIHRLALATLVVVTQPPATVVGREPAVALVDGEGTADEGVAVDDEAVDCAAQIEEAAAVLQRCEYLLFYVCADVYLGLTVFATVFILSSGLQGTQSVT